MKYKELIPALARKLTKSHFKECPVVSLEVYLALERISEHKDDWPAKTFKAIDAPDDWTTEAKASDLQLLATSIGKERQGIKDPTESRYNHLSMEQRKLINSGKGYLVERQEQERMRRTEKEEAASAKPKKVLWQRITRVISILLFLFALLLFLSESYAGAWVVLILGLLGLVAVTVLAFFIKR